jgi:prepilin-type N-terminal cleavage/methylation domain-containing protein
MKTLKKSGFTLLEILIAVSVSSIILVTISSGLVSGIRIWNKVLELQIKKSPPEVLEISLKNDFKATANKNLFNAFYGTSSELRFARFVKINDTIQIAMVEYIYDTENKIMYYSKSLVPKTENSEIEILDEKELNIESLSFKYLNYNKDAKLFEWNDSEAIVTNMPKIISINYSEHLQNSDNLMRSINIQ